MSNLQDLPRRIFLDSCTAQTMRRYGEYIYDGADISETDKLWSVTDGIENVEALRKIFMVNQRASFEWIVSEASLDEGRAKQDPGHMGWLWEVAAYSADCLGRAGAEPSLGSAARAARLDEPKFGYLGRKDRLLLKQAVALDCDAFLTVERRLPTNAAHFERELGLKILTPVRHWALLRPWAALWY